jgi:hypothetical protein
MVMGIRQIVDEHAVNELKLYIDNTGELYPMKQHIIAGLQKKVAKGNYDPKKAPLAFKYLVERGVKQYGPEVLRESSAASMRMFPPPVRRAVAEEMAKAAECGMSFPPGTRGG